MSGHDQSRRKFVKAAAIAAPVLLAYQKSAMAGGRWEKSVVKTHLGGGSYAKSGSICPPQEVKLKCNQGRGNGFEGCDPGNSNNHNLSNDEWPFKIKGPRPS